MGSRPWPTCSRKRCRERRSRGRGNRDSAPGWNRCQGLDLALRQVVLVHFLSCSQKKWFPGTFLQWHCIGQPVIGMIDLGSELCFLLSFVFGSAYVYLFLYRGRRWCHLLAIGFIPFWEEEGRVPGQVSRDDNDNKDQLLQHGDHRPLKSCRHHLGK